MEAIQGPALSLSTLLSEGKSIRSERKQTGIVKSSPLWLMRSISQNVRRCVCLCVRVFVCQFFEVQLKRLFASTS